MRARSSALEVRRGRRSRVPGIVHEGRRLARDCGDVADRISPFAAADTAALQRNCKKQESRPAFPSRTPG